MARINVIEPENADGELSEVYREIAGTRGRIAEVHKIGSLNPASIRDHMDLYRTVMFAKSPLTRAEREMMAVVVSARNGCAYCIAHHGEALDHFWKDSGRVERLATELSSQPELTDREQALIPKALRPFFRHDRRLFSSVSRLIFALVGEFYTEAAGRSVMTGMIVAHFPRDRA